ncbi:hypothetical protein ACMFMG_011450 [Clarireedia jacksonii]
MLTHGFLSKPRLPSFHLKQPTRPANSCRLCIQPSLAMISSPDNPPTTTASLYVPIDYCDIVATQGAYLVPRPDTPVFQADDDQFAAILEKRLRILVTEQTCRTAMYGDAADEWRIGHTPTEIKEKLEADLKAWDKFADITSDHVESDNDNSEHKGGNSIDGAVGRGNYYDIVATQGAYLIPCPDTPVFQAYDDQFATVLQMHLHALVVAQTARNAMYHSAADEWPMGHTPTEIKEKLEAELKAWDEIAGVTSDDESDNDNSEHKGGNSIISAVGRGNTVSAPDRPRRPHQAEMLPTPSMSAESTLSTPHRRKRQMVSEEEDKEKERPAKKHISSAKEVSASAGDAVLNTPQQKSRKRRRNVDMGNREEVAKERPSKVRVTTARPSSIWMQRLRPRPMPPTG